MNQTSPVQQQKDKPTRASTLREERLQHLMESCQQEVLKQIIGPFGLTPSMFDDKDGGNVTTQHNAEQDIFAKESEELNREKDYSYSTAKSEKKLDSVQNGTMNSQEFVDAYTGEKEPSRRKNKNGKDVANFELDHTISVKDIHIRGGWMEDKEGRKELSSTAENLHYTTHKTNRTKSARAPEDALSKENGFDEYRIEPLIEKAQMAIDEKLPTNLDRLKYHGKELLSTGIQEAGKNALRQAFGVLMHEFANGSFVEIKVLLKDKHNEKNLIDRLIESLKRVMQRVISKLKAALEALLQGGIQGFISNFLTFLINNLITTAKKFVTVIREGMQGLWQAIKLMINPPKDMPSMEIARQVTKIIAGVVTTGLGMLMEESVKGFIASLPILVPIADILSAAITAIITGVVGSLVVYGLDRIFDWLSSTGTELLQAYEANMEAQAGVVVRMQDWLELQFQNSRQYEVCAAEYQRVHQSYSIASFRLETATLDAGATINSRSSMIETVAIQLDREKRLSDVLRSI
jgi:hypothetical protein